MIIGKNPFMPFININVYIIIIIIIIIKPLLLIQLILSNQKDQN